MARFILSRDKVFEQYDKIKEHADIVSYSSKTNQQVTRLLDKGSDCYFSVHLTNELKHISDMNRVIFLAQGWDEDMISSLIGKGIKTFVVDNPVDLEVLENYLENNNVDINLYLRLKLKEHSIGTERHFVFGMPSDLINRKVRELKDKVSSIGIHFHRKTQNMSEWNLRFEISSVIDEDVLKIIDHMDMGGGIPSDYVNTNDDVIKGIFSRIDEFRDWLKGYGTKLVIEPGRFIAAPSIKLETKILRIYENNIIVDASVYNSDLDALIVPIKLRVENEKGKGEGEPFVIKGITPCSTDLFRYRVYLDEPKEGDNIRFINAGAYNFHSDFCDLNPIEYVIE